MLHQKHIGLSGSRAEIARTGSDYERYARPLSAIFPESLHRCLIELNEKQESDGPCMGTLKSQLAQSQRKRGGSNLRRSIIPVMEKIRSLPVDLHFWKSDCTTSSTRWYVPQDWSAIEGKEEAPVEDCCNQKDGAEQPEEKGSDSSAPQTGSMPCLEGHNDEGTTDSKEISKTEYKEHTSLTVFAGMQRIPQGDQTFSTLSQAQTIYNEPWNSHYTQFLEELMMQAKSER